MSGSGREGTNGKELPTRQSVNVAVTQIFTDYTGLIVS